MTATIVIILGLMAAAYAVAKAKGLSVELSMFAAAAAGGIAGAFAGTPPLGQLGRHLVEGAFTYLDVILVFFTATLFMALLNESGGIRYVVRATVRTLARRRTIALLVLMVIVLIPGALTGAGSVSLLVVGAPVASALGSFGIPKKRAAAILFILAGLSAAAPPVNIWAMILCAGTAIPYVGFELVLGLPCLVLGAFAVLFLGRKKEPVPAETTTDMSDVPPGMTWWRVLVPFAVFFGLVVAGRVWPFSLPILGLALEFSAAAVAALVLSPRKIPFMKVSLETVRRLLPLLSTMVVVGMLQQVMSATGVRGLLSYLAISTPLVLLFVLLPVIIPVSEGVLTYGGAAVIGIPLIWFLDSIGYHATVVIAGLSLLWPLGDGLPPTALIGRLSNMVSGYRDSYWDFLKSTWVPWLVITAAGLLMIIFSSKLAFLVRWSM
jgi:TRAP-type C4-dicarboxylate transport system permease large subunit